MPPNLIIGSANFGSDYGISGGVNKIELKKILQTCDGLKIHLIDTALDYQGADSALGILNHGSFKFFSKIGDFRDQEICEIKLRLEKHFEALKIKKLEGLFLHRPELLLEPDGRELLNILKELKEANLTNKIGISIYNFEDFLSISDIFIPDIIQIPFNVFDNEILTREYYRTLKELGVEIQVRSVFLQGVLASPIKKLPKYFKPWQKNLNDWSDFCDNFKKPKWYMALKYAISQDWVDSVVCGVNSADHLQMIHLAFHDDKSVPNFETVITEKKSLIDPRLWKT
jgi:aryl-alcohol dehydrogenase-like predicted oxidoreductase